MIGLLGTYRHRDASSPTLYDYGHYKLDFE